MPVESLPKPPFINGVIFSDANLLPGAKSRYKGDGLLVSMPNRITGPPNGLFG